MRSTVPTGRQTGAGASAGMTGGLLRVAAHPPDGVLDGVGVTLVPGAGWAEASEAEPCDDAEPLAPVYRTRAANVQVAAPLPACGWTTRSWWQRR
jgi:hypothetical protein